MLMVKYVFSMVKQYEWELNWGCMICHTKVLNLLPYARGYFSRFQAYHINFPHM